MNEIYQDRRRLERKLFRALLPIIFVPYIIGAGAYYAAFFMKIKKANNFLSELSSE